MARKIRAVANKLEDVQMGDYVTIATDDPAHTPGDNMGRVVGGNEGAWQVKIEHSVRFIYGRIMEVECIHPASTPGPCVKHITWTEELVKRHLPEVQVKVGKKVVTAKVGGRCRPFAWVSWDEWDTGCEVAWGTLVSVLNCRSAVIA